MRALVDRRVSGNGAYVTDTFAAAVLAEASQELSAALPA